MFDLKKYEIDHRTQPTEDTCMSTCIAMVLGLKPQDVIDEFHESYKEGKLFAHEYLKNKGLEASPCYSHEMIQNYGTAVIGQLVKDDGYLAILAVPSLVSEGLLHAILFDGRNGDIFDPLKGRFDKVYGHGSNEIPIKGHVIDCLIKIGTPPTHAGTCDECNIEVPLKTKFKATIDGVLLCEECNRKED